MAEPKVAENKAEDVVTKNPKGKEKIFKITQANRDALIEYLGEFPFKRIEGVVQLLRGLEEIGEPVKKEQSNDTKERRAE